MENTQDQNGNFLNPAYVTPQQAQQLREYAAQLQKGSTAPTSTSWAGALAQGLMGLSGAHQMNQANQQQRQLAQQSSDELNANTNPLIAALVHGLPQGQPQMQQPPMPQIPPQQQGAINPADMGGTPMPPGQNLTGPNIAQGGIQYGPVTGDPSFSGSPNSGAGNPISQALMSKPIQMAQAQPSNSLAPILSSPSIPAEVKKQILDTATPRGGFDAMGAPVVGTTMGGLRQTGVGPGVTTGVWKPQSVSTPNASVSGEQLQSTQGGGNAFGSNADRMMDVATKIGARGNVAKAVGDQTGVDIANMNSAIPQIQILKTMRDDIAKNGDHMTWGPTSPWITNLKLAVAQHAPGLLSDADMQGIASANSFDKLSAQLANAVSSQSGGTDARLMNGVRSVPGREHNSKEGAMDLIDMLIQTQALNHRFVSDNMGKISQGMQPADMTQMRNQFFNDHPIINPATKNPIRLDLSQGNQNQTQQPQQGGGWGIKR